MQGFIKGLGLGPLVLDCVQQEFTTVCNFNIGNGFTHMKNMRGGGFGHITKPSVLFETIIHTTVHIKWCSSVYNAQHVSVMRAVVNLAISKE